MDSKIIKLNSFTKETNSIFAKTDSFSPKEYSKSPTLNYFSKNRNSESIQTNHFALKSTLKSVFFTYKNTLRNLEFFKKLAFLGGICQFRCFNPWNFLALSLIESIAAFLLLFAEQWSIFAATLNQNELVENDELRRTNA